MLRVGNVGAPPSLLFTSYTRFAFLMNEKAECVKSAATTWMVQINVEKRVRTKRVI